MHAYITIYVFFLMALSAVSCKPEHSRGFAYDNDSVKFEVVQPWLSR